MVFGRKKQDRVPSYDEQIKQQVNAELETKEATSQDPYSVMYGQTPFDSKVLEDERMDKFFDEASPHFRPEYMPLAPWNSRSLATVNFTPREAREVQLDIDEAMNWALAMVDDGLPDAQFRCTMIRQLANVLAKRVVGASRHGFLLRSITENRKYLRLMREEPAKKRGIFPW